MKSSSASLKRQNSGYSFFCLRSFRLYRARPEWPNLYEADASARIKVLNRLQGDVKAFRNLSIIDKAGETVAHVSSRSSFFPFSIPEDILDEFISAPEEQYISSVLIDANTSEPLVILAVPIKNPLGDVREILVAETKLRFLWDVVKEIQVGETGTAYVVDASGILVAFSDITRALRAEDLSHIDVVGQFLRQSPSSVGISRGINETNVVSSFTPLDDPNWAVIVELPVKEAYANLIAQLKFSILTVLCTIMVAALLGHMISRRITNPIIRLRDWTRQISSGKFGATVDLSNASHREVQDLSKSFIQMMQELKESTVSREALLAEVRERENAQRALEVAKREAEQASKAKSEFLANMSHEIRTPLNGVIGFTSLLLDSELNDEQQDYLQTINTSGEALLSLINDILDFSKIEADKLDLEEEPLKLHKCVEEALDIVSHRARTKALELTYYIDPSVPDAILGDVTRLRQIIINLLNNAIKFTEKGEVSVSLRSCEEQDHHRIYFSVRDTGIGIPAHKLSRIFDSFSQADSSTTRRFGGTGLGLAISRRLSELMGGSITAESTEGEGSTFTFDILAPATPAPEQPETDTRLLTGKNVLIVDDNETNRKLLHMLCTKWKMKSTLASSAYEVLEMPSFSFDMVLLDYMMPGIDGCQLAAILRSRSYHNPTIILSSNGGKPQNIDLEIDRWLHKPIKQQNLLDAMIKSLSAKGGDLNKRELSGKMGLLSPLRIALADGNAFTRKIILKFLTQLNYEPDVFGTIADLIDSVAMHEYDLVLLDLQLTPRDGITAAHQIFSIVDVPPTIVGMSMEYTEEIRAACEEAGITRCLHKPLQMEELITVLKTTPAKSRMTGQASA